MRKFLIPFVFVAFLAICASAQRDRNGLISNNPQVKLFSQVLGMSAKKSAEEHPMDVSNNMANIAGAIRAYRQLKARAEKEGVSLSELISAAAPKQRGKVTEEDRLEAMMALEKAMKKLGSTADPGEIVQFEGDDERLAATIFATADCFSGMAESKSVQKSAEVYECITNLVRMYLA